ncbi:MAG: carboxypeptidase-like regulatory domain-containing protein, partial [Nanoarchaeota archaeon]|nr:carboxypeptidase-like regulatory domain-containing protein [Nanoarchaeota archaeon]
MRRNITYISTFLIFIILMLPICEASSFHGETIDVSNEPIPQKIDFPVSNNVDLALTINLQQTNIMDADVETLDVLDAGSVSLESLPSLEVSGPFIENELVADDLQYNLAYTQESYIGFEAFDSVGVIENELQVIENNIGIESEPVLEKDLTVDNGYYSTFLITGILNQNIYASIPYIPATVSGEIEVIDETSIEGVTTDTLTVTTDKTSYDSSDTIKIKRAQTHNSGAETVTEYVYVIKSDNTEGYLGSWSWSIPGYSSFYYPSINLDASLLISALGTGSFRAYSKIFDSTGHSISDLSSSFTVAEGSSDVVLSGTVVDEDGNEINNAKVMFTDCSNNIQEYDYTNSNGEYEITINPGSYKLKVSYNGRTTSFSVNGDSCHDWSAGSYDLDLPITIYTSLSGTVQDQNGNKINGAVAKWTTCSDSAVTSDTTDSNGAFTIKALSGSYKLKIEYNGFTYLVSVGGDECHAYDPGSLSLSSAIVLQITSRLTGYIHDEDGNGISGATVKWTTCSDSDVTSTTTDSAGTFTLSATPGNYKLKVVIGGTTYIVTLANEECHYWQAGDLTLSAPITFATKSNLFGTVQDESGNVLSGVTVKFTTCSDANVASSTTDSNGAFTLSAVAGTYKLKVVYGGST